ncbi:MAG: glycosyltransferase, partial [Treponema sp.]|nr:glycosyltransferase [Treponema sp.]
MKMNLSIIIPVYNVERYLAPCLESVLSQDVPGMEVVCVDDGSTDSSLSILRSFAERDPRVSVIEKSNTGYGDSMNAGLGAARGDYVGIVESDDIAIPGMFARMLAIARETGADLVKGTFNFYTEDPPERRLHPNFKDFPTGKTIDPAGWPELFYTAPSVWSALYRKSFLDGAGIRFLPTPGASYQDTSFAFKA